MVNKAECVILLHGLARTKRSFSRLEKALSKQGYDVINKGYPSTKYPIEWLANEAISDALSQCADAKSIHFVTHSMGGILLRQYLSKMTIPTLGRVVMLGPPNQGCEIVDALCRFPGFTLINGPAGLQLGTDSASLPLQLDRADFELGIIAGDCSMNILLARLLPRPNDGKVSVESTKLMGMKQHLVMPVTHSFMMGNNKVIRQVSCFLQHGHFIES